MEPLITVIVPVYNVENYLQRCVESITRQTYKNIELILIDDGSSDASGEICDNLAKEDCRIITVHKQNGGVSQARNTGLDIMHGKYVMFIDADDFVDNDYIECLYNACKNENADISTCGYYKYYPDGKKIRSFFGNDSENITVKSGIDTLCDVLYANSCSASSCCKLFASELFSDLRFDRQYAMGEDTLVIYKMLISAKSIAHTDYAKYYYFQREESATHRKNDHIRFYDYVLICDELMKYIPTDSKQLNRAFANRLIENNFYAYMKLRNDDVPHRTEKEHIKQNIKQYRNTVIADNHAHIKTRLACLVSYGSMKAVDLVYDIFYRRENK